jgi:electron transport complex protein RnfD
MKNNLIVSPAPHLRGKKSVSRIMWLVALSLAPAGAAGVYLFGAAALRVIAVGVISALLSEAACQRLAGQKVGILDGSAFLTGLLLAYNLPAAAPLWMPAAGAAFAVLIAKQAFGGLGQNIFNPAFCGRVFLMACWPKQMTAFTAPFDAVTSATPLTALKEGKLFSQPGYMDLFLGRHAGCIGEVCVLALLLGAAFLFLRGYISWHIPLAYLAATGLITYTFGPRGLFSGDWLFHLLSGGLILGAFFMATDYVTSPLTRRGQVIFGLGCGILTAVIRLWGGYPEGVSYAILMMNAAVPMIDRYTKSRVYGAET